MLSCNLRIVLTNHSCSAKEVNPKLIISRPKKINPRPINIFPDTLTFLFLMSNIMNEPKNIRGKQIVDTKSNEMIYARTVVPICAPIMIGIACFKSSSPALIKPTTITVVALDD